eukprot:6261504-Karenia_brevis.AAC.1
MVMASMCHIHDFLAPPAQIAEASPSLCHSLAERDSGRVLCCASSGLSPSWSIWRHLGIMLDLA